MAGAVAVLAVLAVLLGVVTTPLMTFLEALVGGLM